MMNFTYLRQEEKSEKIQRKILNFNMARTIHLNFKRKSLTSFNQGR